MQLTSSYYQSPIGTLQLIAEADIITAIIFVNTKKKMVVNEDDLEFKTSTSTLIKKCIEQLDEYFAGSRKIFYLPIKQTGTEFQQQVWDKLIAIPYGNTISYLELSKRIGNTKAIRAVGTANGCNNIAIVVPCHRVIGSNGDLTGYAGDLWRKKWLLEHEGKFANGVQTLF